MAHRSDTPIGATSTVVALPELVQVIGQYLDHPDIASCHAWNKILIPLLWRRLDDLAWSGKFMQDTLDVAEEWIRTKFTNYGRHIRHLSIRFNIAHIARQTEECRHLVSLTAHNLPFKDLQALPSSQVLLLIEQAKSRNPFMQWPPALLSPPTTPPALLSPPTTPPALLSLSPPTSPLTLLSPPTLISPIFKGAFQVTRQSPGIPTIQFLCLYLRDTSIAQNYWLLILQNPGLVSLTLPTFNGMDNIFTSEFICSTLSTLKNLKELNLRGTKVDALKVLQVAPHLELLQMSHWNQLFCLTEDFMSLRTLILDIYVNIDLLLKALDRLPGVTYLRVDYLRGDGSEFSHITAAFVASRKKAENGQLLSVRTLEILRIPWALEHLVVLLVQLLPSLVDFRSPKVLHDDIKDALWEHCYFLDANNGKEGAARWRERRMKDRVVG
ncbi:hypothetical protein BGX24_009980 [Mortierella sp. AD032]|nr:hypothetical protein BGX24_009980 [Mortierella sp. AD032]